MKKLFTKAIVAVLCVLFVFGGAGFQVQAANFRDVGPNLAWARAAIDAVSSLGIMTGDLSGNFNPNNHIDKFEAVRILARMSGFNPDLFTTQEAAYYNAVFEARRALIESHANRFTRWNNSVNREIAFLLYTGVLIPSDLNNFVVLDGGTERLRALSREEAAVFLVRFMGRTTEALRTLNVRQFNDDHLISPGAKPHVYFLRSLGIMNGDTNNNVNPRGPATRAAMAILVYATLQEVRSPLLGFSQPNQGQGQGQGQGNFESVVGTIDNTFPAFRSILVSSTTAIHNNRIFPITNTAIITIGGVSATFGELTQGMTFNAMILNGEIVSIAAHRIGQGQPNQPNLPNQPNNESAVTRTLDGIVYRINHVAGTIGIQTRMLNPRGEIITTVNDYTITPTTTILRSNTPINRNAINVGDLVVAEVRGNNAVRLDLEERFREVSGVLAEKIFDTNSMFPMLVVRDALGDYHTFTADSTSTIQRQGMAGTITSRSLRIGDTITIHAEYGRVTDAFAFGVSSMVDVYIRDIFISGREQSHIVVTDTLYGSQDRRHLIVDGSLDPHTLQIGSRVRLWLDSLEVSGITMLQSPTANNFTGHVTQITANSIAVRDANFVTRTLTFDVGTVFFNSVTGQAVNFNSITPGMRVQVITAPGNVNRAMSVTVLPQ